MLLNALRNQNVEAAPGKTGESSGKVYSKSLQYILRYTGKFDNPIQYKNIVIKSEKSTDQYLYLKDISRC
jgi:hydrophobic/amphiphilic exporter-1 (mainly G- bacteria), HAE1 family